jgi:IS30 family transposase
LFLQGYGTRQPYQIGKGHKSAILVTVEHKTRFVQMDLLESTDALTVRKTVEKRFKKLEPALKIYNV